MTNRLRLGLTVFVVCVAQIGVGQVQPLLAQQVPGAPGQPTVNVAGNLVTIAWTAPTSGGPPTQYLIAAGTTTAASDIGTFPVGNATSISASVANGTYFIRVIAANSAGQGPASPERSFTVGTTVALPGAPGTPNVTVSSNNVTISWTAPTTGGAPARYLISAGTFAGGFDLGTHDVGPLTSITATLNTGTYFIRVAAANAAGQGPAAAERSFTVGGGAIGPPGMPGTPSASVSGTTVTLTWTAPTTGGAPTHYLIAAGSSAGGTNLGTHNVGPTTSITTTLTNGTYFVRVIAVNASGQSVASNESSFTVGGGGGGGGINGGWNGLSNDGRQIGFVIANNVMTDIVVSGRVGNCIFTTHVFNQTFAVSGNSFTFTRTPGGSLDPGFTFTATMSGNTATGTVVLTSNDSNCSGNSATITWTTTNSGVGMPLVPGIPAGLQPFVFGRSVNLDWIEPNTPGGATSYDVEIGTSQGGREVAVINTTGLPRNSIGRLAINVPVNPGSYFVRVRGRNASGVGLPTPDQTFFVH